MLIPTQKQSDWGWMMGDITMDWVPAIWLLLFLITTNSVITGSDSIVQLAERFG